MFRKLAISATAVTLAITLLPGSVLSHDEAVDDGNKAKHKNLLHDVPVPDGHVLPNVNYGFNRVGHDPLGSDENPVGSTGRFTDVWAHDGFAYVGTFQEPTCDRSGVIISDIRTPAEPQTIAQIDSPPNTRINDVKTHEMPDGQDILFVTLEPCGDILPSGNQPGQGGVSLYDVSDPFKPHAIKQNLLNFPVHNTFPWTTADGKSYLLVVDDIHIDDTHIVEITKPQSPKLISTTGIGTWLNNGTAGAISGQTVDADGQLFTGAFATPLLHDIWVEQNPDGKWMAVLSYWDAGFITLDVTDPANPVLLGDSTYPDPDPVHGSSPAEGNAHAAVFGGDAQEYIFGGDEDFDAFLVTIKAGGGIFNGTQGDNVPQVGTGDAFVGQGVYVGLGCNALDGAATPDSDIAIIQRGTCAFTTKAQNAQAAGYQAGIVFNDDRDDGGCQGTVSMIVEAGIPMLFVTRSDGFDILGIDGYDPQSCTDGADNGFALLPAPPAAGAHAVDISADFDGWGYFHVINNQDATIPVRFRPDDRRNPNGKVIQEAFVDVPYLGEMGYFAPSELDDPALATGAGDLTMHNLEVDPTTQGDAPSFDQGPRSFISWYSLGMRALEYRPGHFHTNALGEGVFSWNVHEVGRWIAEDGSNFWGVHVTEIGGQQYILGSDRNTGLHIFTFTCESQVIDPDTGNLTPFYCRR